MKDLEQLKKEAREVFKRRFFDYFDLETKADPVFHDVLEQLDIELNKAVALTRQEYERELEVADERWKRAEAHHREKHETDTQLCEKDTL